MCYSVVQSRSGAGSNLIGLLEWIGGGVAVGKRTLTVSNTEAASAIKKKADERPVARCRWTQFWVIFSGDSFDICFVLFCSALFCCVPSFLSLRRMCMHACVRTI